MSKMASHEHLDIYKISYRWKKGRPDSSVWRWSATHRWKALEESYKFASDLIPIRGRSKKLWMPKVSGIQIRTISGLHFGSPGKKMSFGCKCDEEMHRILYGGRWWLPPNSGRGEPSESKVARGLSQHQKCAKWVITNLVVGFGCRTE
jgi:hypothetical protein